jgi:hypothetical protein
VTVIPAALLQALASIIAMLVALPMIVMTEMGFWSALFAYWPR